MSDKEEMKEFREWEKTHKIIEGYDINGDVVAWCSVSSDDIERLGGEYWVAELYKRQTGAASVRIF